MSIDNAFASVAVKDVKAAASWYAKLLGKEGSMPMSEVAEWTFPRGGVLQVYELAERAGNCSFTLAVSDLEEEIGKLDAMGVDTKARTSAETVKTLMIKDPDGNSIAIVQTLDPRLAK